MPRGEKVDEKVYNRAKQKQIFNEKLAQERNKQKRQSNFSTPPSSVDVLGGRYPAIYDPNANPGRTPNILGGHLHRLGLLPGRPCAI